MPQSKLTNTYIYLSKRDKKGVRLLTVFKSQDHVAERLLELSKIPLETNVSNKIQQIIYENRLNWEPWIESAKNYDELKSKLRKRGFTGLPMTSQPEAPSSVTVINKVTGSKTMMQRLN